MKKMKNNLEKTFSTGEFAKLLEVSKDTLLYYDKIDLFKPAGTLANGYRYYTFDQIDQFMAIQSLRAVDLPIKRLKTYFDAPTLQSLRELAEEQHKKVKMEIEKLKDIQQFLKQTVVLTMEMESASFGEVFIKSLPAEPVVYSVDQVDWNKSDEETMEQSNSFFKTLGLKSIAAGGDVYPKEAFLRGDLMHAEMEVPSYFFCHADAPLAKIKPAGDYAILYHQGTYESLNTAYQILRTFLETKQLEIDGDIYEEYLLHSIAAKEEEHYITKISVKVKESHLE